MVDNEVCEGEADTDRFIEELGAVGEGVDTERRLWAWDEGRMGGAYWC